MPVRHSWRSWGNEPELVSILHPFWEQMVLTSLSLYPLQHPVLTSKRLNEFMVNDIPQQRTPYRPKALIGAGCFSFREFNRMRTAMSQC